MARIETASGLELIALQTGWVAIKEPHWRYRPPGFWVVPRIMLSEDWHPWLPVISYAVVSPEGVVLVDTGAAPEIVDEGHLVCDPRNEVFYRRNLRFVAPPDATADRRLLELGIEPDSVDTVVVTHFHLDHSGRIGAFPRARVVTGRGNWPSHVGAVPCTLPEGLEPDAPDWTGGPIGVFERSQTLLGRSEIRLVPLPGHTPGHVGLLLQDGDRSFLVAGDATFSEEETLAGHVAGVSQDVDLARETQASIRRQLERHRTVLLPAHDLAVFERLQPGSGGALSPRSGY